MDSQASRYLSSNHEEVKLIKKKDREPGADGEVSGNEIHNLNVFLSFNYFTC